MVREIVEILLIEDEEAHAEAIRRAFRPLGTSFRLTRAGSLREALAHLEESVPHLVIADWMLPDGKGTDILPVDKERPVFPVVLMTSHGNEQVAVEAMKAGALDYVVKSPSTFSDMPHIAERVLQQWDLINEHKRAQEALRQSERRFKTIFEEAEDCIFLKDRSLKYIDVNPALERLVGRPASDIRGLKYEDLFDRDGSKHIREVEMRVLAGETIEEEHTRRINGISMTFLDTRVPLTDGSGKIVGVLGIARDITDRKRSESCADPAEHYPSPAMQATMSKALLAAKRASTVLLTGESGSGKDYLARYIHNCSKRADGPFWSINCAAIASELAESELFGHEKGAFTGAMGRKRGLLELAEGGTLLLNEIGELSIRLQAKLLTFLDTRKFTRVGGEKEISVDARIIAATNRDLAKEVEEGRFRKDLFYRINVVSITVPPLRERLEDLPILVPRILSGLSRELQIPAGRLVDSQFLDRLKRYNWPGNVRELRNVLERALITSECEEVGLPMPTSRAAHNDCLYKVCFSPDCTLHEVTDEVVKVLCGEALKCTDGNKKEAARILGISRDSLYRYMKKFGMEPDEETLSEKLGA